MREENKLEVDGEKLDLEKVLTDRFVKGHLIRFNKMLFLQTGIS